MTKTHNVVLSFLLCSICIAGNGKAPHKSVVKELYAMFEADQLARSKNDMSVEAMEADDARLHRVLTLLVEGKIKTAEEQQYSALILQHTGAFLCNDSVHSYSRDNYFIAYLLAKSASEKGLKPARRLAADALDRFLVDSGKPQKYGTQVIFDFKIKKMIVPPIDPKTTDQERAEWGVEPLSQCLKRAENVKP